jgi:hypothetical protein
MTIKVVQWTAGGVARAAVRAVLAQPALELVGCYVWSADKSVKDVYPSDPNDKDANTANPPVNAIPAVVAARPGIVTVNELPLITARSVKSIK